MPTFDQFVTPHSHPKSLDSASVPAQFVKRQVELGGIAVTCTDHGTLGACKTLFDLAKGLSEYDKKKKANLIPILGLEAYYRDDDCPILKAKGVPRIGETVCGRCAKKWKDANTPNCECGASCGFYRETYRDTWRKYQHVTIHFRDYEAYLCGVRLLTKRDLHAELHGSERKPIFTWTDMEELASYNVDAMSSCLIGLTSAHILDHDDFEVAAAYYDKFRSLFGKDRWYTEIFPHRTLDYWVKAVIIKLEDGQELRYHFGKKLRTNIGEIAASDLAATWTRGKSSHGVLCGVKHRRIWDDFAQPIKILSVEQIEGFQPNECRPWSPDGDYQKGCNQFALELAQAYGDRVLISDDSHYAYPSHKVVQDIRLLQQGSWRMSDGYHLLSSEEAYQNFRETLDLDEGTFRQWIDNSREWAQNFKDFKFPSMPMLPTKFYPGDPLERTMALIEKHGRMPWGDEVYEKRLAEELELFTNSPSIDADGQEFTFNLLPYFFPIEEICDLYAQRGELTGVGRGSAAGTLLAYLFEITHADPIRYNLSLARFYTTDRAWARKPPDIDQDLPDREWLVEPGGWLEQRFGDHVAQIGTDMKLSLKSSVKDIHRALHGRVAPEVEELTKRFSKVPQGVPDIEHVDGYKSGDAWVPGAIETDPALKEYAARFPKEWEIVRLTLAMTRGHGRHPCGFIICDRPIQELMPLMTVTSSASKKRYRVTQFTAEAIESIGGVKYDFLELDALKWISGAIKLIHSRLGSPPKEVYLDRKRVPQHRLVPTKEGWRDIYDLAADLKVYEDISTGNSVSTFQFGSDGARQWMKYFDGLRPDGTPIVRDIYDLAVFTALDRPGPLDAYVTDPDTGKKHNMLVEYSRRIKGEKPSNDVPDVISRLIPETLGIMCVAENSMVTTHRGAVPIQSVVVGDSVLTESGLYREVVGSYFRGEKEVIKLRLSNGEELIVTKDHRILTNRGWLEAGEITTQDLVKQFWAPGTIELGDDRDWLIGLCLADGDLTGTTPNVCCSSVDFAEKVKKIADVAFGLDCRVTCNSKKVWYCHLRHKPASGTTPNPFIRYIEKLGIRGLDCYTKKFPTTVTLSMVAGFFEGDGSVHNNVIRVKNRQLAFGCWWALQQAHIDSSLYEDDTTEGVWTVAIQGYLPLRIKKYLRPLDKGFIPRPPLKFIPRSEDCDRQHRNRHRPSITRGVIERLAEKYSHPEIIDLSPWGKVISIRPGGVRKTYDLSVAEDHSFVVGGSIVHNCFQESVQYSYQFLTGCTGPEAEEFRRDIAKKKMDKVLKKFDFFVESAAEKLGSIENAKKVWDMYSTFSQYGFNLAHSVCYSIDGYACAYLKHHFPLEWWTSVLNALDKKGHKDRIQEIYWPHVLHLVDMPDVSKSGDGFELQGDRIRAPLSLVDGVGPQAHEELVQGRPYRDIEDFCDRIFQRKLSTATVKPAGTTRTGKPTKERLALGHSSLHRGVVSKLILAGVLDSLFPVGASLYDKLGAYERALAAAETKATGKKAKPEPVDLAFLSLDGIGRYQATKKIMPVYSAPLTGLAGLDGGGGKFYYTDEESDRLPALTAPEIEALERPGLLPEGGLRVAAVAYVSAVRPFVYKDRQRWEFVLDLDGGRRSFVYWGKGKKKGGPDGSEVVEGAVMVFVLERWNEERGFAIRGWKLVREPLRDEKVEGWNIWSGSSDGRGIAAALTNPTELSYSKGSIAKHYPVWYLDREWPDAEGVYLTLSEGLSDSEKDTLMVDIIVTKLRRYPELMVAIKEAGGLPFLSSCSHKTGARTKEMRKWEGVGAGSRFIVNLVAAYRIVLESAKSYLSLVKSKTPPSQDPRPRVWNKKYEHPSDVVLIDRSTKWGNPWSHLKDSAAQFKTSTVAEAIQKYAEWLPTQPQLMASLGELKGRHLLCHCATKGGMLAEGQIKCHGQILLGLANGSI